MVSDDKIDPNNYCYEFDCTQWLPYGCHSKTCPMSPDSPEFKRKKKIKQQITSEYLRKKFPPNRFNPSSDV